MEILDHFENQPSNLSPPITWKTYAQQAALLMLLMSIIFGGVGAGVWSVLPVFEQTGGWLLMVGTFLSTLFFLKKVLKKGLALLIISILVWLVAGIFAITMGAEAFGRKSAFGMGITVWFFYFLGEALLFSLLHWRKKRNN